MQPMYQKKRFGGHSNVRVMIILKKGIDIIKKDSERLKGALMCSCELDSHGGVNAERSSGWNQSRRDELVSVDNFTQLWNYNISRSTVVIGLEIYFLTTVPELDIYGRNNFSYVQKRSAEK